MTPDRMRYQALTEAMPLDELEALCSKSAIAYGRRPNEESWIIHAALKRNGKLIFLGSIYQPSEEHSVWRACEIDPKRKTATPRPPTEAEVRAAQQKPVTTELITEEAYVELAMALTGQGLAGVTRH